ncbi:MAG: endolytic transglycosylase MltG [Sorangiineae bacterium]|nr:endolytic transglycosylase MltG [Polyangiaceae bacterium]MEB2323167.1 endolytic transglycosylase MltG [Sorangiineae bacterium]
MTAKHEPARPSGARRRSPRPARAPRRSGARRPRRPRRRLLVIAALAVAPLALALAGLLVWAVLPGPKTGRRLAFELPADADRSALAARLAEAGAIASPRLFSAYLALLRSEPPLEIGPHLLDDGLSPRDLVRYLARLPARPRARVTIPEGWNRLQIGARLEQSGVCAASEFQRAATDPALLAHLSIRGDSAEGYLFPATYDLYHDARAEDVITAMVQQARKHLVRLDAKHAGALGRYVATRGWGERAVLTMASIVEREARHADEMPIIASVYLNRLDSPEFRPARTLMADPTAGYGCAIEPALARSCAGYAGVITPAMLRDATNRYNTYKHPGLPPGPIANPGEDAIAAVLTPAETDYLFFVATGGGRHTFSRTMDEHQAAIDGARRGK